MPKESSQNNNKDIEENKIFAAAGYLWIFCLVPLLAKKESKFAQFHAKQGLVLFVIEIVLGWIPVIGQIVLLAAGIVSVIGIVQALGGKYWEVPLVADYAKRIKI